MSYTEGEEPTKMNHCQACTEATEAVVSSQYNFEVSRHVPYKIDVVRKKYIPVYILLK